jgi:hypothetical protein
MDRPRPCYHGALAADDFAGRGKPATADFIFLPANEPWHSFPAWRTQPMDGRADPGCPRPRWLLRVLMGATTRRTARP